MLDPSAPLLKLCPQYSIFRPFKCLRPHSRNNYFRTIILSAAILHKESRAYVSARVYSHSRAVAFEWSSYLYRSWSLRYA